MWSPTTQLFLVCQGSWQWMVGRWSEISVMRIVCIDLSSTLWLSVKILSISEAEFVVGLNNWTMIKPFLYIITVHILQTDNPTHKWIFSFKKIFAKLSNLMPCINKLYLSSWDCQTVPRLYVWYPRKFPLLAISRLWRDAGFQICRINFVRH